MRHKSRRQMPSENTITEDGMSYIIHSKSLSFVLPRAKAVQILSVNMYLRTHQFIGHTYSNSKYMHHFPVMFRE